jgi:hypothetical protein
MISFISLKLPRFSKHVTDLSTYVQDQPSFAVSSAIWEDPHRKDDLPLELFRFQCHSNAAALTNSPIYSGHLFYALTYSELAYELTHREFASIARTEQAPDYTPELATRNKIEVQSALNI